MDIVISRLGLCLLTALLFACTPMMVSTPQQDQPKQPMAEDKSQADAFLRALQRLRTSTDFPGATAAYVQIDGKPHSFAIGLADKERHRDMPSDARMLSGSTGKSFVAALALVLALTGQVDLDAPIAHWLGDEPWFKRLPNGPHITLRQLLRHQSGLPDHVHLPAFAAALKRKIAVEGPDAALEPTEIIALVLDSPPLFPAGQGYAYSDTNYILAGLIIERATGQHYYQLLHDRFIDPLQLRLTSAADRRHLPGLVPGYIRGPAPFGLPAKVTTDKGALVFNPATEWTGGGLVTHPRDLARWAWLLYHGKALPGDYLNELLATVPKDAAQRARYGTTVAYGLGVTVRDTSLGPAYGHRGWAPGYQSAFEYYPDHDLAVALQINEWAEHDMSAYLVRLATALIAARSRKDPP